MIWESTKSCERTIRIEGTMIDECTTLFDVGEPRAALPVTPMVERLPGTVGCVDLTLALPFSPLSGAIFSSDRAHRYSLWRRVSDKGDKAVLFIGLNPSTADSTRNDPTTTRMERFVLAWGAHVLLLGNLFTRIATNPKTLRSSTEVCGPEAEVYLRRLIQRADVVVCAWGTSTPVRRAGAWIRCVLDLCTQAGKTPMCLGLTKHGRPRHALMCRKSVKCVPYMLGDEEL